jgi:hypothetical protein
VTCHTQPSKVLAKAVGSALVLTLAVWVSSQRPAAAQDSRVNPQAATVKGFEDRLEQYVALKKKLESGLPPLQPKDRTGDVEAHKSELAQRIREARKGAKQGDLVGDAAPILRGIIEKDAQNRGVRDAYAAMQEVPPQNPPAINASYPEKMPLATVPPLILVNLPRLPDGLEYRFMGRYLILRDRSANLIVDVVPGAVPAFKK